MRKILQHRPCPHGKKLLQYNESTGTAKERDLLKAKAMKRYNNLYDSICSLENLHLADAVARKGKKQPGIAAHDKNRVANIRLLHEMLKTKTFKTSEYTTFRIFEPKSRTALLIML